MGEEATAPVVHAVGLGAFVWEDLGAAVGDHFEFEACDVGIIFEELAEGGGIGIGFDEDVASNGAARGRGDEDWRFGERGHLEWLTDSGFKARGFFAEIGDDGICEGLSASRGLDSGDVAGDGFAFLEGVKEGIFDFDGGVHFPEVAEHEDTGEKDGRWVGYVFAGVFWGGAVDGLEDGDAVAEVGGGGEAEAADEARAEVADDVSVHVGGDDDFELLGFFGELVGAIIDDDVFGTEVGVIFGDFFEGAFHEAFGKLHDIGFGGAVDGFTAFCAGELEAEANDFFAAFA